MKDPMRQRSLSNVQLAERWGVHRKTIEREQNRGNIPYFEVGGSRRIPLATIEDIESCKRKSDKAELSRTLETPSV